MTRHLIIAGVNRQSDYERGTLSIERVLTYQVDSASFVVRGHQPQEGEEVIIEDDNLGRMFAGVIVFVELFKTWNNHTGTAWQVRCVDYTEKLDSKLVVETYKNMTADAIFRDIVEKYCPEFTVNGVRTGAPVVEDTGDAFNYKKPSECFKWLCDYVGWHWQPDYHKDLQFFSTEDLAAAAPMELLPGGRFRNLKRSIDTQGLRNRIYIRGGTMLSDPVTYKYVADGQQRAWILPYKPHELKVSVGESEPITPGVENMASESANQWMQNFQEKLARLSSSQPNIPLGTTVAFTFRFDMDVITMVESLESQEAVVSIQGGDGIYEHLLVDESLRTIEAAEALGEADLREHSNPKVKGSFETEVPGWQPGQILSINLPERQAVGTYLVQKVTITPNHADLERWTYHVEYGGRLLGIADFLRSLISAQQKKQQLNETSVMHKITTVQETIAVNDEITVTHRSPLVYCGDPDAYCGFVECAQDVACDGTGYKPY